MHSLDEVLQGAGTVAISGHVRPDGDCAGSCLAVYNYIRDVYPHIKVRVFLEPIPKKFCFLKNAERIEDASEAMDVQPFDLFIALDCGDTGRLGCSAPLFEKAKRTVCIDHHKTNQSFADVNYIVPSASSTCELVYDQIEHSRLTKEIAECLYLGIVHDTGVFQYSCTSSKTMRIAGKLMDTGIDYPKIVDDTYYIQTYAQQKIWGKAQLDSVLCLDGRCIYTVVSKADMQAFGATAEDLDGIVSHLRSTVGVEVSVFLYETEDSYKMSLRSAAYVDVAEIAGFYHGGGHARAAGATVYSTPKEILPDVLAKIEERL